MHYYRLMARVGILANEFFDERFGGYGGFGVAARLAGNALAEQVDWEPLFIMGKRTPDILGERSKLDGIEILLQPRTQSRTRYLRRLAAARVDALLCIDYRPSYRNKMRLLARTPSIIWVHDPRTPEDVVKVSSLRLPNGAGAAGITPIDCTGLADLVRRPVWSRGRVLFGLNAFYLEHKMRGTYAVSPRQTALLPTPIFSAPMLPSPTQPRSRRPSVIYLGRLDPIKRPWVFVETARLLPEIDFIMTGHQHFTGQGGWGPSDIPPNLSFIGHVEGEHKAAALSKAWLLMNPSIHEALPLSFLEALGYGIPIVSTQDPDGITTKFGRVVANAGGHGLELAPKFAGAISDLLSSSDLEVLQQGGRDWAVTRYTQEQFVSSLTEILSQRDGA